MTDETAKKITPTSSIRDLAAAARSAEAKPWAAYCYVEEIHETEPKLIAALGGSPDEALDGCADAVEDAEVDDG